ncbi:terpene synthase [Cantharellus anzutake]|uniref:terpene synthase n=1 Tax=Cantharellus anzutake TaxID=1750568 RepID=UPI00190893E2|nr:terpene synthase [Cantharellus anzutake]KAF8328406.1 terpene synthase [Cantharellus anzutake]
MRASPQIPLEGNTPFTNYSNWRLKCTDGGRHIWHYLSDEEAKTWPQSIIDKYWLGLPTGLPALPIAKDAMSAARNGFSFYKNLQDPDGHWPGEYGGPMFLLPGLVIGSYVSGMDFTEGQRMEIIRYLINRAHPDDGGWGIHVEGVSTVFGTALNYTVMRLLGVPKNHPLLVRARAHLHRLGGATGVPSWGKFWLSVLNVYDWEGNNPIPPELWLLPDWLPIHPHRWWIHTRQVYVAMSYLYGIRFQAADNELILSLRKELYVQDYNTINWPEQRNNVAPVDIYAPHTTLLDILNGVLGAYECCLVPFIRRRALNRAYELICKEDENTSYQDLGPVNKMINLICRAHVEGPDSEAYRMHERRRLDFMWLGAEGMLMCGTNGSQLWDTVFISQAIVETGLDAAINALRWIDQCQIRENPKHYESAYRHRTKGAWPFSTKEQGYTVSDCTGEGLKAIIYLQKHAEGAPELVSNERLCDAVDTLLTMQNSNGGFASYELVRAPSRLLEMINPAEVFGNIMTDYTYPECTTSVVTALTIFKQYQPEYRRNEIDTTIRRAISYIHKSQRADGSWFGSWGICFTYATMFALESLSQNGETYNSSESVKKACEFLRSKQKLDGGWGETYMSCVSGVYTEHPESLVVQTSWALLGLIHAKYPKRQPLERAVRLIMTRQLPDGSWAHEAIEGIFNKNCAIAYPNFKFSFTIWALGKAHKYLQTID